jgi:3-oxoacyl-[acyl-carrier-protein] synthase-3
MNCFITQTGSFLPGSPVSNADIDLHLGTLEGESEVKKTVLRMNGITSRHYAQDIQQQPTFDVYQLACRAIQDCFAKRGDIANPVSLLAAGTTYAPLGGPGLASILHAQLQDHQLLTQPVESLSHGGICTSAAAAMVSAIRSVASGEHDSAICVGAEHPSSALKASAIKPVDDRDQHSELRKSQWFMSVFLRFMLSDGAGAFLLESEPKSSGISFKVNWTHSRSFAHETPLCMKLENQGVRLSQDISILSKYLMPTARKFTAEAMQRHEEDLIDYKMILPHLSSFFFRKKTERVMQEFTSSPDPVPYWTNLATAGNTGSASIFIMLDHYIQENEVNDGDKLMLFIPESGRFNYVMISLTAIIK